MVPRPPATPTLLGRRRHPEAVTRGVWSWEEDSLGGVACFPWKRNEAVKNKASRKEALSIRCLWDAVYGSPETT